MAGVFAALDWVSVLAEVFQQPKECKGSGSEQWRYVQYQLLLEVIARTYVSRRDMHHQPRDLA